MRYLGGHLGTLVSALLDGQLDEPSSERAWAHVHGCALCGRQVEHEGWVKRRLATIAREGDVDAPPEQLLGSLYDLPGGHDAGPPARPGPRPGESAAWAAVRQIEGRERGRRRTGLALVGAGSVSVAVLGFASLSGATLGISGAPATTPSTALSHSGGPSATTTGFIAPVARVHGRLPAEGDREQPRRDPDPRSDLRP